MSRISLVEAYDNRDVIGQLVRLREDVNELQNILKDIDPDGDLTNVVTKTGDQVIDGIKTFVGKIVADCDIIQLGGNYETHAEQVYSKNDYIVMRDEAVSGLAPGTYSGFQVKKYNGADDARLVVDNEGVARVGDLNDEQPLLTRDEVADMTSGNILTWDGVNKKAITSGKSVSDLETDIGAKVSGTGDIGSDTEPVKIVNGVAVPITTGSLQPTLTVSVLYDAAGVKVVRYGKVVQVSVGGFSPGTTGTSITVTTGLPASKAYAYGAMFNNYDVAGDFFINAGSTTLLMNVKTNAPFYGSFIYITE